MDNPNKKSSDPNALATDAMQLIQSLASHGDRGITVVAPGMQVHVHMPGHEDRPDLSSSDQSDAEGSDQDPELATIRVNLRKLSHKALAELGAQLCLSCNKLYR